LTVLVVSEACSGGQPDPVVGVLGEDIINYGESIAHRYWLRQGSGSPIPLHFAEAPGVLPGTTIAVWGATGGPGEALQVTRFEARSGGSEALRSALVNGEPRSPRRWAFVLVDTGGGVKLTKDAIKDQLFSTTSPSSIRSWYREVSYGIQDLDGDVFGPLPFPDTSCNEDDIAQTLRPMVPGTFDQYLWYIGRPLAACDWAGIGTLGTAARPARDSWYNGDSACYVLIQETGHNFGRRSRRHPAGRHGRLLLPGGRRRGFGLDRDGLSRAAAGARAPQLETRSQSAVHSRRSRPRQRRSSRARAARMASMDSAK
jgi:hypothetical protein